MSPVYLILILPLLTLIWVGVITWIAIMLANHTWEEIQQEHERKKREMPMKEYVEGVDAYYAGELLKDCPYKPKKQPRRKRYEWWRGYCDALKESENLQKKKNHVRDRAIL